MEKEITGESSVRESLFYMILIIAVLPMSVSMLNDYYRLQYLGESQVAVLGITGSVESICSAIALVFPFGVQAVLSKMVGAGSIDRAKKMYSSVITGVLILTVLATAMIIGLRYPISEAIGATADNGLLDLTANVLSLFAVDMIATGLLYAIQVSLFFDNNSRRGIIYSSVTAFLVTFILNLSVTYYKPDLYLYVGAPILGSLAGVVFLIIYKRVKNSVFIYHPTSSSPRDALRAFNVGLPSGVAFIYVAVYQFVIFRYAAFRFSDNANLCLSVFEIEDDISSVSEFLIVTAGLIIVSRLGVAIGSGDRPRITKELKYTWITVIISGIVLMAVFIIVYPMMIDGFVGESAAEINDLMYHANFDLICTAVGFPFYAANMVFVNIFTTRELVKKAHLIYILEEAILYILTSIAFAELFGITGLWFAYPVKEALVLMINFILLIVNKRRLPRKWTDFLFEGRNSGNEIE